MQQEILAAQGNQGPTGVTGQKGGIGAQGDLMDGNGYFEVTGGVLTFKPSGWSNGDDVYIVRSVHSGSFY